MPHQKSSPECGIFLSYRREGGQAAALLFKDRLERAGYRVFYDKKSMHRGQWSPQIRQALAECKDFLLVLNRGALDRCVAEKSISLPASDDVTGGAASTPSPVSEDVMRRETAIALGTKRNVIPLLLPDFKFPPKSDLPEDIRTLPDFQGVDVSISHFDESFEQLKALLTASPSAAQDRRKKRRALVFLAVVCLGALTAFSGRFLHRGAYPSTRVEKQQVERVVSVLERHGQLYGESLSKMKNLATECELACTTGDRRAFDSASHLFSAEMLELLDSLQQAKPKDGWREALGGSPIPIATLDRLFGDCEEDVRNARVLLPDQFRSLLAPKNPLDSPGKAKCVKWLSESIDLDGANYALSVMDILQAVDPSALAIFLRNASRFPVLSESFKGEWIRDPERIAREREAVSARGMEIQGQLQMFVGNGNLAAIQAQRDFEAGLKALGASEADAERISGKAALVGAMGAELADTKQMLEKRRDDGWLKFRAREDDDPGILWNKVLRFRTLKRPDAAKEALAILGAKASPDYDSGAIRSMEALVERGLSAPIDSGVMVSSYEPPATSHAIFRPGDIVVARDGTPVRRVSDWKTAPGSTYRFWRLGDSGTFQSHEAVLPPGQPRVGLVEIAEHDD